jgi:hypothetical protein
LAQPEPFEACLASIRKKAKSKMAVLVFDNLEAVFQAKIGANNSGALVDELGNLIVLCDDPNYAKYDVRIVIVGVPTNLKEYFYKSSNKATVANRLNELDEVPRLTGSECGELVRRGFQEKLQCRVYDMDHLAEHVAWVTHRIPQMVHEYCLELAQLAVENARVCDRSHLDIADNAWLRRSHEFAANAVESHLNKRDTKVKRRNQVLYALSFLDEQFKSQDVEEIIRREFPDSVSENSLNIPQVITQISSGESPLIRRTPKGDAYMFVDPRFLMALRVMLSKDEKGTVSVRSV